MRKDVDAVRDSGWQELLSWLPPDLDELARSTGAIERRRAIRTGSQLLRLCLAYAAEDLSLRGVAAWAASAGMACMSDVAVLNRLRGADGFLSHLVRRLLQRRLQEVPQVDAPLRIKLVDGSTVSQPGSRGSDWRLHVNYDVARAEFSDVVLTDAKTSEHLLRTVVEPGDLLVADRGYSYLEQIAEVHAAQAYVLVRIAHSNPKMYQQNGEPLDPLKFAMRARGRGRPPRVESCPAVLHPKDGGPISVRLIVVRKSADATQKELRRIHNEASRKGKTPRQRTLDAAAFTLLITNVPADLADDRKLAELYRVRWQVELAFKRLKSLQHADNLRAKDPRLARTYLLAKLVGALLAARIVREADAFSPWGLPIQGEPTELVDVDSMG